MNTYANNKRIAKNTGYLYIRMLFSLAISLFTSRVVLNVLGVNDYGVYNVVGGVVAMFTFLNDSMAGATSRFLTYEIGAGHTENLKIVFNGAMLVHIIIALLVVIVSETFGLWFLNNKLVIDPASRYAARWVYQISILTTVISLTQVPYSASIMANERMSVFAFLDIAFTVVRLLIVYLLLILDGNKLILYAVMSAVVGVLSAVIYRMYCIRNFSYCRLSVKCVRKGVLKSMLTFSGWDLYGNLSVTARTQGISMLANMFFGTVANAAMGIAGQVQGAVSRFATNVIAAMKPQIIKSYAAKDYSYMSQLLFRGSKFAFLIIFILALPILLETPFILRIWLNTVPDYTVWICRLALCFSLFSNISLVLVTGVHATGDIRGPSLINGTLYLSVVPIAYFAYKTGSSIYLPFVLNVVFVFFGAMANFFYTRYYVKSLSFCAFFVQVVLRCLLVVILSAIVPTALLLWLPGGWVRFIVICVVSIITTGLFSYYIALTPSERRFAIEMLKKLIRRKV